jgi:formate hydrogenlyase subunit 3/multisubunit Na+/H+ antiporter MnhD subunit
MLGGIGIGLLSGAKNKKILTIVGGVLIAIGIGGLITVGSKAADLAIRGELGANGGEQYYFGEYAFLFIMVAGLAMTIFGLISIQKEKSKRVQNS